MLAVDEDALRDLAPSPLVKTTGDALEEIKEMTGVVVEVVEEITAGEITVPADVVVDPVGAVVVDVESVVVDVVQVRAGHT